MSSSIDITSDLQMNCPHPSATRLTLLCPEDTTKIMQWCGACGSIKSPFNTGGNWVNPCMRLTMSIHNPPVGNTTEYEDIIRELAGDSEPTPLGPPKGAVNPSLPPVLPHTLPTTPTTPPITSPFQDVNYMPPLPPLPPLPPVSPSLKYDEYKVWRDFREYQSVQQGDSTPNSADEIMPEIPEPPRAPEFYSNHFVTHSRDGEDSWPDGGHAWGPGFSITWQRGELLEGEEQNGAFLMTLLRVLMDRLAHYQETAAACQENIDAIHFLQHALRVLELRAERRAARRVLGRHQK